MRTKLVTAGTLAAAAALTVASCGGATAASQAQRRAYAAATQALRAGDLEAAYRNFHRAGAYRDSQQRLVEVRREAVLPILARARSKLRDGHPRAALALAGIATEEYGDTSPPALAVLHQAQAAQAVHHQAQLAQQGSATGPAGSATGADYRAKWAPAFTLDRSGRRVLTVSRSSRHISLQVVDGTCFPHDPRYADVSRRFDHAVVAEQPDAVIVTIFMRPEPAPPKGCAPAGVGFTRAIALSHPLGARALVDGGEPRIGGGGVLDVIRVPASDPRLEREAVAQFGPADTGAAP